jgi:hypothetical protein
VAAFLNSSEAADQYSAALQEAANLAAPVQPAAIYVQHIKHKRIGFCSKTYQVGASGWVT